LTGERLFARSDPEATLSAVLKEPIAKPSSRRRQVPGRLDELVMRALERDEGARWATAGEMLAALNKYLYSLDATPGPREVAALVAQFCPPETRRLPTSQLMDGGDPPPAKKDGPSTAVIPREAAAAGKRPKRAQTFATHVELRDMLGRTGPQDAIDDTTQPSDGPADRPSGMIGSMITDERYDPTPLPSKISWPRRPSTEIPFDSDRPIERPARPPLDVTRPPSRSLLVLIGLGGIALTGAAIYTFYDGREAVLRGRPDAGPADAFVFPGSADAPELRVATDLDAAVAIDAGVPVDAGKHHARDAGIALPLHDAATLLARPDATVGDKATLILGANPWAKVFVDGRPQKGQTPMTIQVSPGHHDIKLVFDAETPPSEKAYSIDIKTGESQSYQADFTH
jgi:hypothetical protein